jgi:hypothetical protein
MRAASAIVFFGLAAGLACTLSAADAQSDQTSNAPAAVSPDTHSQVVDRIVAHVDDDIVALSEVRELAAYQKLVDGKSEPASQLVEELIEQWTINNEARAAQFSEPSAADVDAELRNIQSRFSSPEEFGQRLAALGLTADALRRIVTRELYLTRYLDYRFRPAVQVDDAAIAKYYQEKLVPALKGKNETVPPLSAVTEKIRELLTVQTINDRAADWLNETKSRMKISLEPAAKPDLDAIS